MKSIKKSVVFAVVLLSLGQAAQARRSEVGHEDVFIAKGQTTNGDIVTDKSITVDGILGGDAIAVAPPEWSRERPRWSAPALRTHGKACHVPALWNRSR